MDYKKTKSELTTVTRDIREFEKLTPNVYEALAIIARRSNQIAAEMKEELSAKLEEFTSHVDNLEEVFENREQIDLSRMYERLPKPVAIAIHEFVNNKVYFRKPEVTPDPTI